MQIFAIGDLHLGFGVEKPMDIFGEEWKNHSEKVMQNWKKAIAEDDIVLLAGDLSWAMREADAWVDLDVIDNLPGKKILMEGNHDYWWKSKAKLERRYPKMHFLKNNCVKIDDLYICGTRGWTCPNEVGFTPEDAKIYEREQVRLRLSLDAAMAQGAKEILLMMHFPPMNEKHEESGFTSLIAQYPIVEVVYGHLHGKESHEKAFIGERNGVQYHLVAADFLDFCPKRIR